MSRSGEEIELDLDRPEPGARRPRHTREQIAAAALAIADAEGFEAVSMRRVAAELGAGTMTLYHYVRTKDELVDADGRRDHGRDPDPRRRAPGGLARGDARDRAPLARDVPAPPVGDAGDVGLARRPERHAALRAVAGSGLLARHRRSREARADRDRRRLRVRLRLPHRRGRRLVLRDGEGGGHRRADAVLRGPARDGEYPEIENLFGVADARLTWERIVETITDSRFETGLDLLLDGIEAKLVRDGVL